MSLKKLMMLALAGLLVISSVLVGSCAPTRVINDVSPQEAATLIQNNRNNADFVILDVRTPGEFADGHIANAVNIDYLSASFRDEINQLDKRKTYLVYCHSGGRSLNSAQIMEELNFSKVYNMLGGTIGWEVAGLPLVK